MAPGVLLLGCVKTQLDHPAPADELFCSPLFRLRREYAERSGRPWFVVSSRYGLVAPDEVIAPYDFALARQPIAFRRLWGLRVADELAVALGDLARRTFEIHAGAAQAEPLTAALARFDAGTVAPLRGLNQGQHLAWYGARR